MGQTDRPDDRRAAGSRLPSNSESAVKRNHETPKSGIPKRKKIEACPRLSCKIQYLLASNHSDQSTASEYFTADYMMYWQIRPRKFMQECEHDLRWRYYPFRLKFLQPAGSCLSESEAPSRTRLTVD